MKYYFLVGAAVFAYLQADWRATAAPLSQPAGLCRVTLGEVSPNTVSPFLFGYNTLYCMETEDRWADGFVPGSLKESGGTILRYPGGHVVSAWHWQTPFYPRSQDSWNPAVKARYPDTAKLKQENANYMDLDEYIAWSRKLGTEPLLGVNLVSGHRFNRVQDGIDEAVAMVKYCKAKNYGVRYLFLDNEVGHKPAEQHVPAEKYPEYVKRYSEALKAADPNLKLACNYIGNLMSDNVKRLIRECGKYFDIYDQHWYYQNPRWGAFYRDQWLASNMSGMSQKMDEFKKFCAETGNSHLKLAFLEWNLGPSSTGDATQLDQALVMSEMMMTYVDKDVFMACLWPLLGFDNPGNNEGSRLVRSPLDIKTRKHKAAWEVLHLFNDVAGGHKVAITSSQPDLVVVAVTAEKSGQTFVYLLNKTKTHARDVEIALGSRAIATARGDALVEAGRDEVKSVPVVAKVNNQHLSVNVKPLSLTRLTLTTR